MGRLSGGGGKPLRRALKRLALDMVMLRSLPSGSGFAHSISTNSHSRRTGQYLRIDRRRKINRRLSMSLDRRTFVAGSLALGAGALSTQARAETMLKISH